MSSSPRECVGSDQLLAGKKKHVFFGSQFLASTTENRFFCPNFLIAGDLDLLVGYADMNDRIKFIFLSHNTMSLLGKTDLIYFMFR
jgi:hypothetical protein